MNRRLTKTELERLRALNIKNIKARAKAGSPLTPFHLATLEESVDFSGGESSAAVVSTTRPLVPARRVWLNEKEFLEHCEANGCRISKKTLHHTYGLKGRYPIRRNKAQKWQADEGLAVVKMVSGNAAAGGGTAAGALDPIAVRQAADAEFRNVKAHREKLKLELELGTRVPIDAVVKVWAAAAENIRNEVRTAGHTLPIELAAVIRNLFPSASAALVQQFEDAARAAIEAKHHDALRNIATEFSNKANAEARK